MYIPISLSLDLRLYYTIFAKIFKQTKQNKKNRLFTLGDLFTYPTLRYKLNKILL